MHLAVQSQTEATTNFACEQRRAWERTNNGSTLRSTGGNARWWNQPCGQFMDGLANIASRPHPA
ncbi:hypothetical protein [Stratiformator vulcanicus]|uniref:hypothetical protein n=1 Tax=Stratiformator vulcanicus TaxID=2527980 RepID=UPI0011A21264|nr:hypothetical protein [Stratiformator vulcanicus]